MKIIDIKQKALALDPGEIEKLLVILRRSEGRVQAERKFIEYMLTMLEQMD